MPKHPHKGRGVSRGFGDRSYQPNPNNMFPEYIPATPLDPNPSAGRRVRFEPATTNIAPTSSSTDRPSANSNRAEFQLRSAETMEIPPAPLPPRPFSFFEEKWLFICITGNFPLGCTDPKDWNTLADKFKDTFEPRSALSLEVKWKELMARGVTIQFFAEPLIESQRASAPAASGPGGLDYLAVAIKPEPPAAAKKVAEIAKAVKSPAPSNPVANGASRRYTPMQEKWLWEWAVDNIDGKWGTAAGWRVCAREFRRRFGQERSTSGLSLKWKQMWDDYGEIESTSKPVLYGTAEEDGEDMGEVIVVRNGMAKRG
ncbi:hypothetical protein RUND412_002644 [Rhizina undulata]